MHVPGWRRGSGEVPTAVFGRPDIARTALCTLCGDNLTLHHVLLCKARNIHAQGTCSWPEIFNAYCCEDELKAKITFFGQAGRKQYCALGQTSTNTVRFRGNHYVYGNFQYLTSYQGHGGFRLNTAVLNSSFRGLFGDTSVKREVELCTG